MRQEVVSVLAEWAGWVMKEEEAAEVGEVLGRYLRHVVMLRELDLADDVEPLARVQIEWVE